MRSKTLAALLSVPILSGCYVIAPFPGGYVGFDVPPVETRVSTNVTIAWDLIPGTSIYYAPQYPDILYYGGSYYYVVNGVWYLGSRHTGPWRILHTVPDAFLYIPPTHPEFRVVHWHPRYHNVYKGHTPAIRPIGPGVEEPGFRRDEKNEPPGQFRRNEPKGAIVTPPPHGATVTPPPQNPHNPPPPQKAPAPQPPKEPKKGNKPAEKPEKEKEKDKDESSGNQPAPFVRH